jgi:hypothetical protein
MAYIGVRVLDAHNTNDGRMQHMEQIRTAADLDDLPVGSVVLDLGRDFKEFNAPVVLCKALAGDWQIMGDDPERRWRSHEVVEGSASGTLVVVYDSMTGARAAMRRE